MGENEDLFGKIPVNTVEKHCKNKYPTKTLTPQLTGIQLSLYSVSDAPYPSEPHSNTKMPSDVTKFVTEIPMLLAFCGTRKLPDVLDDLITYTELYFPAEKLIDPTFVISQLKQYLPKVIGEKTRFNENFDKSVAAVLLFLEYCSTNGYEPPYKFRWRGTHDKYDSEKYCTTDITFFDANGNLHPLSGVQVKAKSQLNNFNLSVYELSLNPNNETGDLYHIMARVEFEAFWRKIAIDMLTHVDANSEWYKKTNKYSIKKQKDDWYIINAGEKQGLYTRDDILNIKVPQYLRRVVGDYYQKHKQKYSGESKKLVNAVKDAILNGMKVLHENNPSKEAMIGGFLSNQYLTYFFDTELLYLVPPLDSVKSRLDIKYTEPTQKDFGCGICIPATISTGIDKATANIYTRYNGGTFAGSVVLIFQNLKDVGKIWQLIEHNK